MRLVRANDDDTAGANFAGEGEFALWLDPETAREFHDETLPQEGAKDRALLFYVCPAFLVYEDYRRCS